MKILAIGDPHGTLEEIRKISVDEVDLVLITGDLGDSDLVRKYYFKYEVEKGEKSWKTAISKEELQEVYTRLIDSGLKVLEHFSEKPTLFVLGNLKEFRSGRTEKAQKDFGISIPNFSKELLKMKNVKNISFKEINLNKYFNKKISLFKKKYDLIYIKE